MSRKQRTEPFIKEYTHTHLPNEKRNIKETKERKLRLNKFCQVSQPSGRPKKLRKIKETHDNLEPKKT